MRSQAAGPAQSRPLQILSSVALVIGLVALAGCGSSSNSSSSSSSAAAPAATPSTSSSSSSTASTAAAPASGAQTLALAANPEGQLKFTTSSLSAKAGTVTIAFENKATIEHNVTVASPSGATLGATPTSSGGTKTLTVTLKPGTYKFYCSVPGHRQAGMEGTLTVH